MSTPEPPRRLRPALVARAQTVRDAGARRARQWSDGMLAAAETGDTPRCGTRWGRGALAAVPATAAAGVLAIAIAQGILAANFNVANQPFSLHVDQLQGKGLGAVLAAESVRNGDGTTRTGALHAGLAAADLKGVCIVVHESLLGVDYTITVGSDRNVAASGDNLFFDITNLSSTDATLRGAILGESADAVAVNGQSLGGTAGAFGLDNTRGTATLEQVNGTAYQAQIVGALKLPNLAINVKLGKSDSC